MNCIDLNCDMGEGIGNEALLMPFISSANIACGFHAGDEAEMQRVVSLCLKYNVAIGAHPSFPDRENFGRTEMHLPATTIQALIHDQLDALNKIVIRAGGKLHHIKPHGALYNMAAKDRQLASTIASAVKQFNQSLILYGLSGSAIIEAALDEGLTIAHEVFADRAYRANGSLQPRNLPGALITDAEQAIQQVIQMVTKQQVTTVGGENIFIQADTVCIHGDGIHAVEFAETIHHRLATAGIQIQKI